MVATAPPAQRWLLIEQEGAWPVNALDVFGPQVASGLAARAASVGARISLIRRPGRHPRRDSSLAWAFADVRPGHEGIRWGVAGDIDELLSVEWQVTPGEGETVALVCAHSRHDVCCAIRGRPVVQTLASIWPGRAWECSHLGGDRFAATMVLLPVGLCYGRMTPENVAAVIDAHERGRVIPDLLRGRCAFSRQEQAAQSLARGLGFASEIDALMPMETTDLGDDQYAVTLAADPPVTIRLRERTVPLGTPATCRSTVLAQGREFDLLGHS
jgi:(2Fe-2S) ferredoxin